jgi:hypothetical protein
VIVVHNTHFNNKHSAFFHRACLLVLCNFSELTVITSLKPLTKERNALKVLVTKPLPNGNFEKKCLEDEIKMNFRQVGHEEE